MKFIKPSFKIIEQEAGLNGIYKNIELAGRTCYKSEDKITPESAKGFVERMIKAGHGAILEHGTVYLKEINVVYDKDVYKEKQWYSKYRYNKYSKIMIFNPKGNNGVYNIDVYVTTNLRVLVENGWLDDLLFICEPTEYHEKRVTVKFTCDRGVSHEFVRHRVNSFAQESTRYCNYNKDKFNKELNIIQPCWTYNDKLNTNSIFSVCEQFIGSNSEDFEAIDYWLAANAFSEFCYMKLIERGWKAQQARQILPTDLKTELVMTGFISDWQHFFYLRCDTAAHPQAQELAISLKEEFIKRGYIK